MAWIKQTKFRSGKKLNESAQPKTTKKVYQTKYKRIMPGQSQEAEVCEGRKTTKYKKTGIFQEKVEVEKTKTEEAEVCEDSGSYVEVSSYVRHNSNSFIDDWTCCRDRHPGQTEVLKSIFDDRCQYVFYRAGRKGAKTTTAIDAAWRAAHDQPNRVIYLCYPTIAQGIEVVWEERRLQTCDQKDDYMFDKYVLKVDDSRHIVKFHNGSFVKLIGTWSEARGRGTQPDFLIFDEFQDCSQDYIDAMDPNLAAKENAQCLMMGTPPKKRNHYEQWYDRVEKHPRGKVYHYTSYDNIKLPHLKEWLDNKKIELVNAGSEDVWLREYMAELCYSSADRILPDAKFLEKDEMDQKLRLFAFEERIPILGISTYKNYICCILAVLIRGKMLFVMDCIVLNQVWNLSLEGIYPRIQEKVKILQDLCLKKIRNIVWDESGSFVDVVNGFTKCRKDIKWQDRGIPLLREMMTRDKIFTSIDLADFGLECQNLLIEESIKDIQKTYPIICTISMIVNEYFSQEKITLNKEFPFDKWDAFREMGIPCPPKKRLNLFSTKRAT